MVPKVVTVVLLTVILELQELRLEVLSEVRRKLAVVEKVEVIHGNSICADQHAQ